MCNLIQKELTGNSLEISDRLFFYQMQITLPFGRPIYRIQALTSNYHYQTLIFCLRHDRHATGPKCFSLKSIRSGEAMSARLQSRRAELGGSGGMLPRKNFEKMNAICAIWCILGLILRGKSRPSFGP